MANAVQYIRDFIFKATQMSEEELMKVRIVKTKLEVLDNDKFQIDKERDGSLEND